VTGQLNLHWFLPAHGDGVEVAKPMPGHATGGPPRREPDVDYLGMVALAAERAGFSGALVPFGLFCEDPWLVSAGLAQSTSELKFMIAIRPGLCSPLVVAQMGATLQRMSGGRVMLNVVTGGDPDEQRRYGDWLSHAERYERTAEFLAIVRRLWSGETVSVDSRFHRLERAMLPRPPSTVPTLFVGGSSEGARQAAAAYGDVYLAWGETPPLLADLVAKARVVANSAGRKIEYGSRFHVIARDTAEEAWQVADRLLAGMDPERIEQAQRRFRTSESEGQRRSVSLHGGRIDRLAVYPNIWAGYGLVRPGAGATLVGSHEEVADRICELYELGLDHLILSAQPHLEEAYNMAEGVMPLLRQRGVLVGPA
jgi:alkanesulfonate monooxygenase